jgi:drug/metabolite transporter (DMT)-like permease
VTAVALALLASLSWGVSDFVGGLQTRSIRLPVVLALSMLAGLATAGVVLLLAHRGPQAGPEIVYAVAAGPVSVAALGLLYQAMAAGPIVVAAPVAAVGAVVPVGWDLAHGEALSGLTGVGIGCALVGATLAAWPSEPSEPSHRPSAAPNLLGSVLPAAGAAFAIGTFLVLLSQGSQHDALWAAAAMRLSSVLVALVLLLGVVGVRPAAREVTMVRGRALVLVLLVGVSDMVAETCYALATTHADLGVVAVLASLYPAVTVLLAMVLLDERARVVQRWGIGLALAGVAALAGTA